MNPASPALASGASLNRIGCLASSAGGSVPLHPANNMIVSPVVTIVRLRHFYCNVEFELVKVIKKEVTTHVYIVIFCLIK